MKRFYTLQETAKMLGYTDVKPITQFIAAGLLPAFQPKKRCQIKIDCEAAENFIKKHTQNAHLLNSISKKSV